MINMDVPSVTGGFKTNDGVRWILGIFVLLAINSLYLSIILSDLTIVFIDLFCRKTYPNAIMYL